MERAKVVSPSHPTSTIGVRITRKQSKFAGAEVIPGLTMVPNVHPTLQTVRVARARKCRQLEKVRHSFSTSLGFLLRSRTIERVVVIRVFDQKFGSCTETPFRCISPWPPRNEAQQRGLKWKRDPRTFVVPRGNADVEFHAGVVELGETPIDQAELLDRGKVGRLTSRPHEMIRRAAKRRRMTCLALGVVDQDVERFLCVYNKQYIRAAEGLGYSLTGRGDNRDEP